MSKRRRRIRKIRRRYAFADGCYAEAEADGKVVGYRFAKPEGWEW